MEILLWLVPSAVVTVAAMCWVSWVGRGRRREIDPEQAALRLARALRTDLPAPGPGTRPVARDRSTGVAVRPSRRAAAAGEDRFQTRRGA